MSDPSPADIQFLDELNDVIAKNLGNDQFGVTELADAMNMSRSNLLRKVKKSTNLPVNQLIREARLKRAMELLQNSASNVSEISHQVGFSSTSYFIKCFREHYGYPPGEAGKRGPTEPVQTQASQVGGRKNFSFIIVAFILSILIGGTVLYFYQNSDAPPLERSIVVLPFKNDSNDSTNVYLINGLMESTLSNLQKIEDLRVLSRTSSEKYRNTSKSITEMSGELGVNYLVEGSGQKIGDQILLNIQLIEGPTDKHLWSKQYRRKVTDIFELQQEVAKNIAEEIEVVIGPEAKRRIEQVPTTNLEAYDAYLKGKQLFYEATAASLPLAMTNFRRAIELDDRFGLAYAHLVMVEYYTDIFRIQKTYTEEIGVMADKAMLFDPKSSESLIAKALAYAHGKEYKSAVLYLEKALEYNPHAGLVFHFLTEFYSLFVQDREKYIEYSLKGAKEDRITMDSSTVSFKLFHLSNALMQAGFIDEGLKYMDEALTYDPEHYFARYIGVLFRYAKNKDLVLTKELLIKEFEKDTSRADIVKELSKIAYIGRDYTSAYKYYNIFLRRKDAYQLEIYGEEDLSIAFVFDQVGEKEKAKMYLTRFKTYVDSEPSIYKPLLLSMYYSYIGDVGKSIEQMKIFSKQDNYQYWMTLAADDPMMDAVRNNPEFKKVMKSINDTFWDRHKIIKVHLEEKGLYPFETFLSE